MEKRKYGYLQSKEIIENSKYPQISSPMAKYRGDRAGENINFEWNCITKPLVMDDEPEVNDFDQFLFFVGGDIEDISQFQAEIELPLGKEKKKQIINEPSFVYIPGGLPHGPLNFKKIKKPIAVMTVNLSSKYSTKWFATSEEKYVTKPPLMYNGLSWPIEANHPTGTPFRYIKMPAMKEYWCWSKRLGFDAQLCLSYGVIKYRDYCDLEPWHYHRGIDQWLTFLGGNSLNIEDFDAEIEMWWGTEREKVVIDSPCVCHVPPGLIHMSNERRRVGKPFIAIMMMAGTGDYFKDGDKVLLSKEEEGDVMIAEGARDWVPVTKELNEKELFKLEK